MVNIKDNFCDYNISVKLKELGFNEGCLAYYVNQKFRLRVYLNKESNLNSYFTIGNLFSVPLYQQVFDWFEKEHLLFSSVRIGLGIPIWYDYMIQSIDGRIIQISKKTFLDRELEEIMDEYEESSVYVEEDESFETKREAQIACINKLIEIVKEEKNEIV